MTSNREQNTVIDTLFNSVMQIVNRRSTPLESTMTELNKTLVKRLGNRVPSEWPGSPSALRLSMNKIVNRLRNAGVSVRFVRTTDHTRKRLVVLTMH